MFVGELIARNSLLGLDTQVSSIRNFPCFYTPKNLKCHPCVKKFKEGT